MATNPKETSGASGASDEEIEAKFRLIAPSLGLPQSQIDRMTLQQKSTAVLLHNSKATTSHESISPEAIIKRLESGKDKEASVRTLRTSLRSELVEWSNKFLELNGHQQLFEIYTTAFSKGKKSEKDMLLVAECCRCIRAIMNTPEGLQKVLDWPKSIEMLFDTLEVVNILSQEELFLMLAGLCFLTAEAHVRILTELRRGLRFPQIMEHLNTKNEALCTAALTFVNAIIGVTSDTQSRVEIRNEFLKMNIKDIVNKARHDPSQELKVQIKCFNDGAEEDLDTLIKAGAISAHVNTGNSDELKEQIVRLETQVRSLQFEVSTLKEENTKLKSAPPTVVHVPVAASEGGPAPPVAPAAPGEAAAPVEGGPPPPPAPGGGPPPPPPPPGGGAPPPPPPPGGGPPPPPPPPGGGAPPPPPPPGGGPPPPPGGPGGPPPPMAPKRPAKAKCKPNKKMRAFGWNKIADAKIDNTIWEKTNDSRVKLDTLELESLFGANESAAAPGPSATLSPGVKPRADSSASPSTSKKQPAVQLLDPKRSNNCEIMLRGLKMEPAAIKAAIMALDEKVLTEDTLKTMKEFVPLPEEISMLKEYSGDKKQLGRAEQYFLAVMDIPKLSARLTAMAFKAGFQEKSEIAKSETQALTAAIAAVKGSKHLFELLEIVLAVGNYLNGAGNNGGCYGFRINSLNKMMDVKTTDNKMTLIHYLYDLISKKHKEVLGVLTELSCCQEASRLNIRETVSKVSELKAGFATIDALLADATIDSAFSKAMAPFSSSAKSTLEQLESRSSKLESAFKECVTYYGEPASTEPEDFFGALSSFLESFGKAKADNEKRAAAAAKEAQSKALLAAVQSKQVTKKKGQLDDAIEGMKSGAMFARLSVAIPPGGIPGIPPAGNR